MTRKRQGYSEGTNEEWMYRQHAFEAFIADHEPGSSGLIDLEALRQLCSEGIPDEPSQIRPLMYNFLLGVLPAERSKWRSTKRRQRSAYYALLDDLASHLQEDNEDLSSIITRIKADVDRLIIRYPLLQGKSRPRRSSSLYPIRKHRSADSDSTSSEATASATRKQPLTTRRAIFQHIEATRRASTPSEASPPRITLSSIPLTPPMTPKEELLEPLNNPAVTLLSPQKVSSRTDDSLARFDNHTEVLIRILTVISRQHTYDPAFATIIAPLYLVYAQALEGENVATYAEEEVYWALLAIIDRTQCIWTDAQTYMSIFGARLKWVDEHLYSILVEHELDPALPLYSYRWLTGLLAGDLPLSTVLPLWDVILASPKPVDALIDLCCAVLLASKKHLSRSRVRRGLWGDVVERSEMDFVQVLTFLRAIPVEQIGDTAAILGAFAALQTAGASGINTTTTSNRNLDHVPKSPKVELASRLAGLTLSVGPQKLPSTMSLSSCAPTPPRPLMLQDKARRASGPISSPLRRSSTSSSASLEATLSPPTSTGLYRLGSRQGSESPGPRRTLLYDQSQLATFVVGLGRRRPLSPRFLPAMMTVLRRKHSNYPGHVPLNTAQNALLAAGSGVVGVLDTSRGDLVATLSESTASTFLPSLHAAMTAHPEGRQIMQDRPIVSSKTIDLDRLRTLQRGTLGREYVEWLSEGGLTPDTREKVRYIDSPTLAYTMLRYRQTHDLYHTLFSLPPTLPHELTLKVVELSNMSLPVAGLSSAFGPFRLSNARRAIWLKDWAPWALRVGRESKSLVGVYWEKRWEQGLGDLRRELGVYRNDSMGVESRWRGYREIREKERDLRHKGEWVDEPESW